MKLELSTLEYCGLLTSSWLHRGSEEQMEFKPTSLWEMLQNISARRATESNGVL
jgi:hypothetical protein